MAWDADATIQLISVLISILGIGIACYNHQSIIAAIRWVYTRACGKRIPKSDTKDMLALEFLELRSWDDPDIEAGAATLGWAEEVKREVEKCWA